MKKHFQYDTKRKSRSGNVAKSVEDLGTRAGQQKEKSGKAPIVQLRSVYAMLLLIFLASLIVLTGCTQKKEEKDAPRSDARQELRLNFVSGPVSSLNPHQLILAARGKGLGKWLFEGLTRLNLSGEYELAGAESLEISPCKTHYTFKLKENRYCDGSLVTAYDYERCWKEVLAPEAHCLKAHLLYYLKNAEEAKKGKVALSQVGVKALDKTTLAVELEHPTPHFLSLLSTCVYAPFKEDQGDILFNGPYTVGNMKEDHYLELVPNPFFWDRAHTAIKKIHIFMVKDAMTALSLYKENDLDWIGDPFTYLPPEIVAVERDKGNFFKGPQVIFPFWVYVNTESLSLSSHTIRQAFRLVLDQNEIVKYLFKGHDPLLTPVPSSSHQGTSDYDLTKGKALFEQGLRELGLTKETFPTLKIISSTEAGNHHLFEHLQQVWQQAFGIKLELEVYDWNTFYAKMFKGDYHIGGFFTSSDYYDPLACLEFLASDHNLPRWKHQRYCDIIEHLKREDDVEVRGELLNEATAILNKETPIIWLVNQTQYHAYPENLKGVCFDQMGMPDFRYAYFE